MHVTGLVRRSVDTSLFLCVFLLLTSLLQGARCLPQSRCPSWPWEQEQLDFSLPVRRKLRGPGTLQAQALPRAVADPSFSCSEQP